MCPNDSIRSMHTPLHLMSSSNCTWVHNGFPFVHTDLPYFCGFTVSSFYFPKMANSLYPTPYALLTMSTLLPSSGGSMFPPLYPEKTFMTASVNKEEVMLCAFHGGLKTPTHFPFVLPEHSLALGTQPPCHKEAQAIGDITGRCPANTPC